MKTKNILLSCLCLSLAPTVWAEDLSISETDDQLLAKNNVYSGSRIKVKEEDGEVLNANLSEGVISLGDDKYMRVDYDKVRIEEDKKFKLHGNWLTEYKVEHFKNEGTSTSSRPVHEWVFADGRVNFGDSGFNLGYILKKVSFENDLRDGSGDVNDFRMNEMELRPAYAKSIGKHWFMIEATYLGKSGYEKKGNGDDSYLIGGDGYGIRPYYSYQFNDDFGINTDLKWLTEDKSADGADAGKFVFYEALFNVRYNILDNLTAGVEFFHKDGDNYDNDGVKGSNLTETEIRPWVSWRLDQHNFFFKLEPQKKTITEADGRVSYESNAAKYIVNYSYPITSYVYFVAEYFYRTETDKKVDGAAYTGPDGETNFGKIGLNFVF
ncbi:hypothetical protein [Psychromonas aquimarina]|uniref:hypothetical protein n=1 Tax=Psychromonas aquimarina TaxID=444919 RepID=UPI00048A5FC5|nr:hypothetical protein [Psychromonas aquimarina]